MTIEISTVEPTRIRAGDTVKWTRELADFLPADLWVLTYRWVNRSAAFAATATDNGDGKHLVTLTAADTAAYAPGEYHWLAVVTLTTERYTVGEGDLVVEPNLAVADVHDHRSHARRMLDALETRLELRAPDDVASYSIEATSVSRMSPIEVDQQYRYWRRRVREEEALAAVRAGKPNPMRMSMTMTSRGYRDNWE